MTGGILLLAPVRIFPDGMDSYSGRDFRVPVTPGCASNIENKLTGQDFTLAPLAAMPFDLSRRVAKACIPAAVSLKGSL